jgi:hypothetical protein
LDKKKVGAGTADACGNVKKAIEVFGIPWFEFGGTGML